MVSLKRNGRPASPPLIMELISAQTAQNQTWHAQYYEPTEREKLERLWTSGQLQRHLDCLDKFYQKKRAELRDLIAKRSPNSSLIDIAKQLVIETVIVDRITETIDQIAAIEAEIWIQGEHGNFDRDRIVAEWTDHHAAQWRRWRIKEYLYTTEQMEDHLLSCLQKAS